MSKPSSPKLSWKDNKTPQSEQFDDVYFSAEDGIAESRYVFLEGNNIPACFKGKRNISIGETGFGTGLNFLLTWQAWKESNTDCNLHYISVEAFPLSKDQLAQAYEAFPELTPYTSQILKRYPHIYPGFHHIVLEEGRVTLTLLFGLAENMLNRFEGKIDAWYLDGFAPSKNPDMWCDGVFHQLARSSHKETTLATFTAAGFVRRGLENAGFLMSKRKGFGRKRECLTGKFQNVEQKLSNPWFAKPTHKNIKQKIAVIGAGIAGCTSAKRLQEDGHDVILFDRNAEAGCEGSGNRLGLIKPRLVIDQSGTGKFNPISYLKALDFYEQFGDDIWVGKRGLFHMVEDDADALRQKLLIEKEILPDSEMQLLSAAAASKQVGIDLPRGGLWYPNSGCVEPGNLCKIISKDIPAVYGKTITKIQKTDDRWQLLHEDQVLFDGDTVVLATAGETSALNQYCELPLSGRRGQVNYVQATDESLQLRHALACNGYLIPAQNGEHLVGASFEHWPDFFDHSYKFIKASSLEKNTNKFKRFLPEAKVIDLGGRASIRAMSPDHHPMVGPVFSTNHYVQNYERLKHGPRAARFKPAEYVDGLYVIIGLGARGIQTAPLLADLLCSYISNTPSLVEQTIRESLHPARFLIREIKKAKP